MWRRRTLSKSMYPLDEDRSIRVCVAVRVSFVGVVAAVVPVDRAHAVKEDVRCSSVEYSALVGRRVRVWIRVSILTTSSNPRSILRRVFVVCGRDHLRVTNYLIIQVPRRRCIVHHATRPQRQSVFLVVVADR